MEFGLDLQSVINVFADDLAQLADITSYTFASGFRSHRSSDFYFPHFR